MNTKMVDAALDIKRKEAMVPYGLRLPRQDARVLNATARRNRCRGADILRTAWQEYMVNHQLEAAQ